MALELAGIALDKLIRVEVLERARIVRHAVPGLSGDLAQDMGRPSVAVRFQGILYGPDVADRLKALRDPYLAREPVDFLAEISGQGYFSQVIIDSLRVAQRAGYPDEFAYACEVTEYVPPPPPASANPLGDLDAGILDEAIAAMDDIQNAIAQVADLANLLAGAAGYGDPTTRLPEMLSTFTDAAGGAAGTLRTIADLL
jgi:hypothetical protein